MPGRRGRWLPGVHAARQHRRADVRGDLGAGVVLAALLIPQGMAYAELAGLPPVTGLYTPRPTCSPAWSPACGPGAPTSSSPSARGRSRTACGATASSRPGARPGSPHPRHRDRRLPAPQRGAVGRPGGPTGAGRPPGPG
ncbi:MAG: SulP family inorganic anion transporter [Actinomycetota bacterium]